MLAIELLRPVRRWIDSIEIHDRELAHQLCKLIPDYCPFERDVKLCGRSLFHLPPLCKLNPLYEQLVGLRFRALCYLVGERSQEVGNPNTRPPTATAGSK
jgi:hypothetical protein